MLLIGFAGRMIHCARPARIRYCVRNTLLQRQFSALLFGTWTDRASTGYHLPQQRFFLVCLSLSGLIRHSTFKQTATTSFKVHSSLVKIFRYNSTQYKPQLRQCRHITSASINQHYTSTYTERAYHPDIFVLPFHIHHHPLSFKIG
jgi:hypothetical protein